MDVENQDTGKGTAISGEEPGSPSEGRVRLPPQRFEKASEYYRWAALPAIALLLLELLLVHGRLRVLP